MSWDEDAGSIVTGAIGLGVGLAVAGKVIKDFTSIKSLEDGQDSQINRRWRL